MNLAEAILELKKMNRNLHKVTKAESKEMLREMQEYIENMEVPELLKKPKLLFIDFEKREHGLID